MSKKVRWVTIKVPLLEPITNARPSHIDKLEVRMLTQQQRNTLASLTHGLLTVHATHQASGMHGVIPVHRHAHAARWLLEQIDKADAKRAKSERSAQSD